MAKRSFEGCSPLVFFPDPDIVVPPVDVKFGEQALPLQVVDCVIEGYMLQTIQELRRQ